MTACHTMSWSFLRHGRPDSDCMQLRESLQVVRGPMLIRREWWVHSSEEKEQAKNKWSLDSTPWLHRRQVAGTVSPDERSLSRVGSLFRVTSQAWKLCRGTPPEFQIASFQGTFCSWFFSSLYISPVWYLSQTLPSIVHSYSSGSWDRVIDDRNTWICTWQSERTALISSDHRRTNPEVLLTERFPLSLLRQVPGTSEHFPPATNYPSKILPHFHFPPWQWSNHMQCAQVSAVY